MMLSKEEGTITVRLARSAIIARLSGESLKTGDLPPIFKEKRGVFVTLHKNQDLRGCIGYPEPVMTLLSAITDSAVNAALHDPRFPPVQSDEIAHIMIEVTVLTPPTKISAKPQDLPKHVEIGKHGIIVKKGLYQGLLLPQVAEEWGFDAKEFLSQTCIKAGLSPDAWLTGADVFSFEGQIFTETTPNGEIVEQA